MVSKLSATYKYNMVNGFPVKWKLYQKINKRAGKKPNKSLETLWKDFCLKNRISIHDIRNQIVVYSLRKAAPNSKPVAEKFSFLYCKYADKIKAADKV